MCLMTSNSMYDSQALSRLKAKWANVKIPWYTQSQGSIFHFEKLECSI